MYDTHSGSGMECVNCEPGQHASSSKSTGCSLCAPGRYASSSASTECSLCAPGKYASSSKSEGCSLCAPGKYASSNESTKCFNCSAGKSTTSAENLGASGHDSPEDCVACPPGKHSPRNGTDCKVCGIGTYTNVSGTITCELCPAGTGLQENGNEVSLHDNLTDCTYCQPGFWHKSTTRWVYRIRFCQNAGASTCDGCSPGMFRSMAEKITRARTALGADFQRSKHAVMRSVPLVILGSHLETTERNACPRGQCSSQKSQSNISESCKDAPAGRY